VSGALWGVVTYWPQRPSGSCGHGYWNWRDSVSHPRYPRNLERTALKWLNMVAVLSWVGLVVVWWFWVWK
jgi:hypothetical protein